MIWNHSIFILVAERFEQNWRIYVCLEIRVTSLNRVKNFIRITNINRAKRPETKGCELYKENVININY